MDETVTVEDGATIVTFDWEHNMGPYYYNAKDRTLTPKFDRGDTVTFNPNGGALKDGKKLSVKLTRQAQKTASSSMSAQ